MKINKKLYDRLVLQAEEAEKLGMNKIASNVLETAEPFLENESIEYSYADLENDISKDIWKMATRLFNYYQINNIDIKEFNKIVEASAETLLDELEDALDVKEQLIGATEPKVV